MESDISIRARVDSALETFVASRSREIRAQSSDLGSLANSAEAFLRFGGKRLRPLFSYWGYRAAGGEDDDAVIVASASLELIQACALAHDDVIDESDLRRGRPAIHREWQRLHERSQWTGDPHRFGVAVAVLIGDLFLSWSDDMLVTSGLSDSSLRRAYPIWHQMRAEVVAGQFLDVVEQAQARSSIERSLLIAELKSGRYSVQQPLRMGAAIAAANDACAAALDAFGLDVGVAFQLRDDLLGVFGDPAVTGKPAGDDLRQGKRTVLVAAGLESASVRQRAQLEAALGNAALGIDEVVAVQQILRSSGAEKLVESMISDRAERAIGRLESTSLLPAGRDALRRLATAALDRSA